MEKRNITAVEGLRFLLFLGVFLFNCGIDWFSMAWGGGVQAFLVIGSYFLTKKYLKFNQTEIKIGNSFLRRLKRLYPIYFTIIIGVAVFYFISTGKITGDSLWYIFVVQNFRCLFENVGRSLDGCLGHFWYIGLDLGLFLVWVVLMKNVPKHHLRIAFIVSLIIGLLWRTIFIIICPDNLSISYVIPFGQLDCWSIGGLLALNIEEEGLNKTRLWMDIIVGVAGLILFIGLNAIRNQCDLYSSYKLFKTASGYMDSPIIGNIHIFKGFLAAGLLRYCLDTSRKHPILSSVPLVALGGMTYELYCFHLPILALMRHFVNNPLLLVFVALLVTYAVSWLWCRFAMPVINKILK